MSFSKVRLLLYLIYILSTSVIFFNANSAEMKNKNISFFFQDTNIKYKVQSALALDPGTQNVLVSRTFDNKFSFSMDTFLTSAYESIDIPFLFGLSNQAPLYGDVNNVKLLFPIEFPLFIFALIYVLRTWKFKRDKYFYLFFCFLFSLFVCGLFLPTLYPPKLFPLVLVTRTIILFGITDYLFTKKWLRKYFS